VLTPPFCYSYKHLSKIERGKPAPNLENVDSAARSISQERGLDRGIVRGERHRPKRFG
jgi:uncharacterized linocin/CFP29 family protein